MLSTDSLKNKFNQISSLYNSVDGIDEHHKANLCLITINTLIYLGDDREVTLPFSFSKLGASLERYVESKNSFDDVSYLICASFLKEYYLYKKYIDREDFSNSDVNKIWEEFKELSIPISSKNSFFDNNFYKQLKNENDYLDNLYIYLGVHNNLVKQEYYKINKEKQSILTEIDIKKNESLNHINENNQVLQDGLNHFTDKVDQLRSETNALASTLNEQKTAFNFVGLSQGFESLLKKKRDSQLIVLSLLFFIGVFLFIPLFTYIELNQIKNQSDDLFNWKMFLPFVSIELISLYLFRVVLTHYNSIKTQIMQLELRQTLCQFIQSYVEYAKEIKEKDSASLEKFENLIFSSILSTPDKVPSTFDGLEQLSNFIKNIKSGN